MQGGQLGVQHAGLAPLVVILQNLQHEQQIQAGAQQSVDN
jgi:hypothetical protein